MTLTDEFIRRLEGLQEGERSRLRQFAGMPLDETLSGFDLFTGLWWPLRRKNRAAPRRETSWLVAKLWGAYSVPHIRSESSPGPTLAQILGRCEPPHPACGGAALLTGPTPDREPARSQFLLARRFRRRFDALLCSQLEQVEPRLRWAFGVVEAARHGKLARVPPAAVPGLDWVQLLDDLSVWDRADEHKREIDVREMWAENYIEATNQQRS